MTDRELWIALLTKVAEPVLVALDEHRLKRDMPVETQPGQEENRRKATHLEALGRTLVGLAPWLDCPLVDGEESQLRDRFASLARRAIVAGTHPQSPDFCNFTDGWQPLVDAAFLAHAILRAPVALWKELPEDDRKNVTAALKSTRNRKPAFCNWLLFSAIIEACLCHAGEDWDPMRVDYAIRQHEQWYKGDGVYGDGPAFHWDYYNSYVIQPMLMDVLLTVGKVTKEWESFVEPVMQRATRYAAIQERLIAPDGSFPAIGRSLAYRCGAFQHLAQVALQHRLPDDLPPAQVRSAMTAMIRRTLEPPGTFDADGWLTIGLCGHQPAIGEGYISTGSLYLCTAAFLPLGLPPGDPFWSDAGRPWTSQLAWTGRNLPADHAL
jgi:hypothetical protein